jgi:hypothetical protein
MGELGDDELREVIAQDFAVLQAAYARLLGHVYELDRRPGSVPGARPGSEAVTYLRHKLRLSNAGSYVTAARALAEDLPQLGEALAAGEVSREHVGVAVQALRRIPRHLLDADGGMEKVDTWVTETSRELPPAQTQKAARHLLAVLDPGGGDTFDPASLDRRELSTAVDLTGMTKVEGWLDPANGAWLRAALDHFAKPHPADPDAELSVPDTRTPRQRQADALGLIARLALGVVNEGKATEVDRPHVVIHVPLHGPVAECEQTGPVSEPWLARFLCDAVLERVTVDDVGRVVGVGRSARTASPAQRRALVARDRTCVVPDCTTPAAWSDAHHVAWWSRGGATDLDNLAMVCGRHHADVHAGVWELEMRDGVPWARPPTWIDPLRRWRRNTYPERRRRAEQLAVDLNRSRDHDAA